MWCLCCSRCLCAPGRSPRTRWRLHRHGLWRQGWRQGRRLRPWSVGADPGRSLAGCGCGGADPGRSPAVRVNKGPNFPCPQPCAATSCIGLLPERGETRWPVEGIRECIIGQQGAGCLRAQCICLPLRTSALVRRIVLPSAGRDNLLLPGMFVSGRRGVSHHTTDASGDRTEDEIEPTA